jgi:hypothetical protein
MDLHLQPNWHRAVGQLVEIRLRGQVLRTGIVESVMPDESILWISADGLNPREMVERADGKEVFVRYSWEAAHAAGSSGLRRDFAATDTSSNDGRLYEAVGISPSGKLEQ